MAKKQEVQIDRRMKKGERRTEDRRKEEVPVAVERRQGERREKVARRRQIDPTTCERDYTEKEVEFMNALDDYKRKSGRMFPTCSEVLEVIRSLGYVKLSHADAIGHATGGPAAISAKPMPIDWLPHTHSQNADTPAETPAPELQSPAS